MVHPNIGWVQWPVSMPRGEGIIGPIMPSANTDYRRRRRRGLEMNFDCMGAKTSAKKRHRHRGRSSLAGESGFHIFQRFSTFLAFDSHLPIRSLFGDLAGFVTGWLPEAWFWNRARAFQEIMWPCGARIFEFWRSSMFKTTVTEPKRSHSLQPHGYRIS